MATSEPLHLIEKVAGQWYVWPYAGDREQGTRVLRIGETIAGPFGTRQKALVWAMQSALEALR